MPDLLAQLIVAVGSGAWIVLILLGLPGTWLAIGVAALCEWATETQLFHGVTLGAVVAIALAGELWELLSSSSRARRAGATRSGAFGALAGGIAGAILGTVFLPVPLLGTLAGGGIGAFAGSALVERGGGRELGEALKVGRAAAVGHVVGMIGKVVAGLAAWALLAVAVLVP